MTDTVMQSIFASGSLLNLPGSQHEEEHNNFPGSKNEEALVIFAKIGKYLEGRGDWLKCDGLFDAVVSLVKECTDPKYVEEMRNSIGHERDPSYFNEPITMSISLSDVKKYLTDVAKGDIEISFENNDFIKSPYHLQRLAVLKLEKLFPPESSSEVEEYGKLKRQIQFRILLNKVTQCHIIDDQEYNLLYSFFVQDRRMIDTNDVAQMQEICEVMLKVLMKEPKHSDSFLILQTLLDEHSFAKSTVTFCETVINGALESWKSKGNYEEVLLFLNELQEPLSTTVEIFDFLKAFYEDVVASGAVDESSLYQVLLADGSHALCEKLQVIINSYRKHVFPLETSDEIVQSVLSICLLKSEANMWRMLHYASRKLNQHCLEIVLQMLLALVQRSLFHDLRTVLTRQVFAPMKSLVLLLGWKYVFLDFEAAKCFLSAIEYSEKTNPSHTLDALASIPSDIPSFEHPELQKKAETIKNQIDLINWCNEQFSNLSPECTALRQHPSVVFNGLDHYTPLYVLNSSTNIGVLPKNAVITQLSNKLLYNSFTAETDSQRDIETYHAFDVIQIACKALLQSCRHNPDSFQMYEGVTTKLLKELTKVLALISLQELQVETLENLFSLLFVKYSQLETEIMNRFEVAASSSMLAAQLSDNPSETSSMVRESVPILDPLDLPEGQVYRQKSLSIQDLSPRSFSISIAQAKERSSELRAVPELENTGSRSSDGYTSNTVGKFSESGYVASIPFIRDLLHVLKQAVVKLSEIRIEDKTLTDRLTKFETVLDEAINRFLFVTTLQVGENFGKFCPDADYLCGFPEKTNLCLRRASETPHDAFSCIDQMLSDPISLVFKCIWRKDFGMAERVVEQYGLKETNVADILAIEKSYENLFRNVADYAVKEARYGGGRSLRRGAFTLQESDDDAEVSVLAKIANRASLTLESMTIPEMVEYFVLGCDKEHSATKFLDRKTKETYLKYMIENTDISVRFDLICSCALSADLTLDLSRDVWDEVGDKLQFYEPKKNSGEIGGFNYAVVTLKNLLESDACEETSLAEVLSNSAVPLETEKHKYFADRQRKQTQSRRKLLKILNSSLSKALALVSKASLDSALTSSTRIATSSPLLTKSRFPRLAKGNTPEAPPTPSPPPEEVPDEAARSALHEAVKEFLKAFCSPDPVLRSLYLNSSRRDVPFDAEPPSRILFLDVLYEYVKKFASYLIDFDKKFTKSKGQPWNLKTPDNKIIPVKKLYECPFLLLTQSPTEIVCDMVFNKNESLSSLEKMCEDLCIDLSELVCNRLQVSLPWRCLTLLYNADSVMGCSQKPLNLVEIKLTAEEESSNPTGPDLGDTVSVISSNDAQQPIKAPNQLVEDILDQVIELFAASFSNSGAIKGEDLMDMCDSFELESILDETSAFETVKCQSFENDDQRFAFFCNVYNLMMIHGSILEAKAIKNQKDHMGLSCLIGGSSLERLAFELRLEYCLGEFGTLSAWQIRNCILRKGKRPWKSANFVKPFFDALNAFSTLKVESVKKFDKLEEQFLLIDCTIYSPVIQIVKAEKIMKQVEEAKHDWLQKFVQISRNGIKIPQLLQEYLWDKYSSEFKQKGTNSNTYDWISLSNFEIFKDFLAHYLEQNQIDDMKALALKGLYQVEVIADVKNFEYWKVQYEFDTVAGFTDLIVSTFKSTDPNSAIPDLQFHDGVHLCERPDRRLCKTYPLQESIKEYLASKNQVQGRLIEMIHEVTDSCNEIEISSMDREVRTSTTRGFSFTLTASTAVPSHLKPTTDYLSIIHDIINSKTSDSFQVYKVWANKILEPLAPCSNNSSCESLQKLLCVISEHGLLSGSKCPKVVKRCFAHLETILKTEENSKDLNLKLSMLINLLKQESVNEARFQPLFDLLLCAQSFTEPDQIFEVHNAHIRTLFMLENLEKFPLDFALDFLNAANREEIENPNLKRNISLKFREVSLFRQILKIFPTREKQDTSEQWAYVKSKFSASSHDDIVKRVCIQYSRFKMAKVWCELNPNVSVEIREEVQLLSMKDFAKKGRIIRFVECLHQLKFSRKQIFSVCQEVLKCCDVTSSCIVITFLLDKITSGVFDFIAEAEIEILRNQYLSLLMLQEVPGDSQSKFLQLIRTPILIIHQLFMNSDIDSLKKIFLKLSVIYGSQHLEEKRFLGEGFIADISIEYLQQPVLDYARLALKLEQLMLNAYLPKLIRSDSVTSLVSMASNKEPEEQSISFNLSQNSGSVPKIRIITETDPEWVKDSDATHCCICKTEFGYLSRRHHCRTCGRIICSKCRSFQVLNNITIGVCEDCLKSRLIQDALLASNTQGKDIPNTNVMVEGGDANPLPPVPASLDSSMFEDLESKKAAFWKLPAEMDDAKDVIQEFFYTNAPSFCLFESILALHLNVLHVVTFLFDEVKLVSEYFNSQKKKDQTEATIANNTANMGVLFLMQNLMKMAKSKIQRGNVTKSTTAEIDMIAEPYNFYNFKVSPTMDQINELEKEFEKLSSGIEALQLLLRIEYDSIPSLSTIIESVTHNENVTTQLMKQGKFKEALEFCQKCDLDAKRVYKKWGMSALKAGSLEDARSFFKKCLDNSRSFKNEELVNDIIETMETNMMNPPPSNFKSFDDFWSLMEKELSSEVPTLISNKHKLEECAFYVETYLPCRNLVSFYADRGEMKRALEVFTDSSNLITAEDFSKNLFKVAVQLGEKENGVSYVEELLKHISESDANRSFWRKFLLPIASNADAYKPKIMVHLHLVLEDYVRAGEAWCSIYDDIIAENYKQLHEKHSHILDEAEQCFDHAAEMLHESGVKIEGNKYLTTTELHCLKDKVNLQRQVAEFLASSNVARFPELSKKIAQLTKVQGEDARTGVPTLLGCDSQCVRVVAALMAEYQSGTGFNLATDTVKFLNLNMDEVGLLVARELQADERFRSILYLASSFSGSKDPELSSYTDRFLSRCVEVCVEKCGQPIPSAQLNRLKELVDKIKNIDVRICCFITMGDLQQAQLTIVKKDRNGIEDMNRIIELAESGNYKGMVNLDQFISMCRMWLKKFESGGNQT